MVDTGFRGLLFLCQIIGSIMRKHGYGKIINLSSTFSRSIIKGRSVYGGIKAGVSHLTETLALESGPGRDQSKRPCANRCAYSQPQRSFERRGFGEDTQPYPVGSLGHSRRSCGCYYLPFQPGIRLRYRAYYLWMEAG